MIVLWLFLALPRVCLQFVIAVFLDHTHYFSMHYQKHLSRDMVNVKKFQTLFSLFLKIMLVIRAGIHKMLVGIRGQEENVSDCSLQGSQVQSQPGTILSWRLIMK